MLLAVVGVGGCGGSSSSSSSSGSAQTATGASAPAAASTSLTLSIAEAGKKASYSGPTTIKGGLVTVALTNNGKGPHGAQLLRLLGGHTPIQALMVLGGKSNKTPSWLRGEGGVGQAPPGMTVKATVNLPPGNYAIADAAGAQAGGGSGPPAYAALTVTPGQDGALPTTPTTVTGAAPSKDHYRWQISGSLKAGANDITFVSKGKQALHVVTAVRVTGNPSLGQVLKDFKSNGPPPRYVDRRTMDQTAVLDGGKSLTTQLTLRKPGTYIVFCPLADRDGGKPHVAEGMLTKIAVK